MVRTLLSATVSEAPLSRRRVRQAGSEGAAIHRREKRVFTDRKDHHWGMRKLARDR
jgi:hypothetical protein